MPSVGTALTDYSRTLLLTSPPNLILSKIAHLWIGPEQIYFSIAGLVVYRRPDFLIGLPSQEPTVNEFPGKQLMARALD